MFGEQLLQLLNLRLMLSPDFGEQGGVVFFELIDSKLVLIDERVLFESQVVAFLTERINFLLFLSNCFLHGFLLLVLKLLEFFFSLLHGFLAFLLLFVQEVFKFFKFISTLSLGFLKKI